VIYSAAKKLAAARSLPTFPFLSYIPAHRFTIFKIVISIRAGRRPEKVESQNNITMNTPIQPKQSEVIVENPNPDL
jgi:hypothetical protein